MSLWEFDLAGCPRPDGPTMGALEPDCTAQLPNPPTIQISETTLYVGWNAHPDPTVLGYHVFHGNALNTATQLVATVPGTNVSFKAAHLAAPGEQVCFRLKAYNSDGASGYTAGVCAQLPESSIASIVGGFAVSWLIVGALIALVFGRWVKRNRSRQG